MFSSNHNDLDKIMLKLNWNFYMAIELLLPVILDDLRTSIEPIINIFN